MTVAPLTVETRPLGASGLGPLGALVGVGWGGRTTTVVSHVTTAPTASFAVQVIGVEPTEKTEPDGSQQPVVTGAVPPDAVALKVTVIGPPFGDVAVGAGHEIVSELLP